MTDYRLLQLGKDTRGEVLPKGQPTLVSSGVMVTLADSDGNVMIEHSSAQGAAAADVRIDGKPVYEVAHLRPLQVVEVDGSRYVLMPPYGSFVQQRDGHQVADAAAPKAKKTKAKPKAKGSKEQPRRLKLVYVAAPALLIFLGVGLSLVPEQKPAEAVTEQVAADENGDAAEAEATPEEDASNSPDDEVEESIPETAKTSPTPSSTATLPLMLQPVPQDPAAAQPAADKATAGEVEADESADTPAPKPAKQATPVKSKEQKPAAGKSLSPEREAQIRSLAESYQLEGGFDPEGAAKKLRALKKQVPANARVQSDIDKAIRSVGG